jgi:serine phosphatase RsbU (regulator of sigma subunit)
MGRGFAGTIAASGKPVAVYDVDHSMVLNPILSQKGVCSLLGVPLVVHGDTLGVLHVGTLKPRHFTPEDVALLQLVGDRVAVAINAGLYERERDVARTLQRSLLPEKLPTLPGFRFAARYLAAPGGDVGGDWYDSFLLPSGSIAVAIGDVAGRGLGAASVMGRLRNALRAYALELSSPRDVLESLSRLVQHLEPEDMATAFYGTIDPSDLSFRFSTAGHMPPIIRDPDGTVRIMTMEGGPPLGVPSDWSFSDTEKQLFPGSSVVIFTDGLVERRDASLDDGFLWLSELCRAECDPEKLCHVIVDELTAGGALDDDVAFLVIEVA